MKIKLAILDSDTTYLKRLVTVFGTKYSDKVEVHSFTEAEGALAALNNEKIDVFIADEGFMLDISRVPQRCGFSYFVESTDVDTVNGQHAICKFQKIDQIYKEILGIFSECAGNISGMKGGEDTAKVLVFSSPCGGAGTSCMAAAYAKRCAKAGKRVLYLNLERFSTADVFFKGEGPFGMSDVVFAVKNKKMNLALKLESCVKCSTCGVYYYSPAKVALERMELTAEEINDLISRLRNSGSYDIVVVDTDFDMSKETLKLMGGAHRVVWVGDGSEASNAKIRAAFESLAILEKGMDFRFTSEIRLIYNKFSNKTGKTGACPQLKDIGGLPRLEHATSTQVVEHLAGQKVLDDILN